MNKYQKLWDDLSKREKSTLKYIYERETPFVWDDISDFVNKKDFIEFVAKCGDFVGMMKEEFFLTKKGTQFIKHFIMNVEPEFKNVLTNRKIELLDRISKLEKEKTVNFSVEEQSSEGLIGLSDDNLIEITNSGDYAEILPKGLWVVENRDKVMTVEEELLVNNMLSSKTYLYYPKLLLDSVIVREYENKLLTYLIAASKNRKPALSLIITGSWAGGKNLIPNKVLELMEQKNIYAITRSTESSIDRLNEEQLNNSIIYFKEMEDTTLTGKSREAVKLTISEGELGLLETIKNEITGEITAQISTKKANVCFISTRPDLNIAGDEINRMFVTSVDVTREQTENVLKKMAENYMEGNTEDSLLMKFPKEVMLLRKIFQKLDYSYKVINPFACFILDSVSKNEKLLNETMIRRDFKKILNFCNVVTLMHQYSRPKLFVGDDKYLITSFDDIYITFNFILKKNINEMFSRIPKYEQDFYIRIKEKYRDEDPTFKIHNIVKDFGYDANTARRYSNELRKLGFLTASKEGKENLYRIESGMEITNSINAESILSSVDFNDKRMENFYKIIKENSVEVPDNTELFEYIKNIHYNIEVLKNNLFITLKESIKLNNEVLNSNKINNIFIELDKIKDILIPCKEEIDKLKNPFNAENKENERCIHNNDFQPENDKNKCKISLVSENVLTPYLPMENNSVKLACQYPKNDGVCNNMTKFKTPRGMSVCLDCLQKSLELMFVNNKEIPLNDMIHILPEHSDSELIKKGFWFEPKPNMRRLV